MFINVLLFITIFLLFEESKNQDIFMVSIWSVLVFIGGFILNIGGAFMLLKSATVKENLKQSQDLAKAYKESYEKTEKEKKEIEKKLEITEEHCSTYQQSYNALAGIVVKELLNFSELVAERDMLERRCKKLEEEVFELRPLKKV